MRSPQVCFVAAIVATAYMFLFGSGANSSSSSSSSTVLGTADAALPSNGVRKSPSFSTTPPGADVCYFLPDGTVYESTTISLTPGLVRHGNIADLAGPSVVCVLFAVHHVMVRMFDDNERFDGIDN